MHVGSSKGRDELSHFDESEPSAHPPPIPCHAHSQAAQERVVPPKELSDYTQEAVWLKLGYIEAVRLEWGHFKPVWLEFI
jgi:hypothetical protein